MAVLALTTGLEDMKQRLGNMVFANDLQGRPLTCDDLVSISGLLISKECVIYNYISVID